MAIQYVVKYGTSATGPWTDAPGSPFSTPTDTVQGLASNTSYWFQIYAVDTVLGINGAVSTVGPYLTAGTVNESPDKTRLTSTSGTIIDASGGTWSLVSVTNPPANVRLTSATSASLVITWDVATQLLQVKHPNAAQDGTSVTVLLYYSHTVYRSDANGWAKWNGTGWTSVSGDPTVTTAESAQGTTVSDTTTVITDGSGNTFKLFAVSGSGLEVTRNGVTDASTANTVLLLYYGHQVYKENSTNGWSYWTGSQWTVSNDPRLGTLTPSPNNTVVSSGTGSIVDSALSVWTLVAVTGQGFEVSKSGVLDTSTANTTLLLYLNTILYRSTSTANSLGVTPGWTYWNGNLWSPINGDPRGVVVTWSTTDKSASVTVSNNNLTAASTGAVSQSVRSSSGFSTGKLYAEGVMTTLTNDWSFGISTSAYNLGGSNELGGEAGSAGFYPVSPPNSIYVANATTAVSNGSRADVVGALIRVAVDIDNKLIWFSSDAMVAAGFTWNNSATANPATGVGGISFTAVGAGPYFITWNDDVGGAKCTVNFGATGFIKQPPSGFSAWSAGSTGTSGGGTGGGTGTGGTTTNGTLFNDDFDSLPFYDHTATTKSGNWMPAWWYDPRWNGYLDANLGSWDLNPLYPATQISGAYGVSNSIANLAVIKTPSAFSAAVGGASYVGTFMQTQPTFQFTYGYVETRWAAPKVPGTIAAFWLANDQTWPPEIDINETVNGVPVFTVWSPASTTQPYYTWYPGINSSGLQSVDTTQMHQYGVNWQTDTITFYIDRIQCAQCTTPAGMDKPMFMIIGERCGNANSDWTGPITNPALLPATLQVDYVKVWKTLPFTPTTTNTQTISPATSSTTPPPPNMRPLNN